MRRRVVGGWEKPAQDSNILFVVMFRLHFRKLSAHLRGVPLQVVDQRERRYFKFSCKLFASGAVDISESAPTLFASGNEDISESAPTFAWGTCALDFLSNLLKLTCGRRVEAKRMNGLRRNDVRCRGMDVSLAGVSKRPEQRKTMSGNRKKSEIASPRNLKTQGIPAKMTTVLNEQSAVREVVGARTMTAMTAALSTGVPAVKKKHLTCFKHGMVNTRIDVALCGCCAHEHLQQLKADRGK